MVQVALGHSLGFSYVKKNKMRENFFPCVIPQFFYIFCFFLLFFAFFAFISVMVLNVGLLCELGAATRLSD